MHIACCQSDPTEVGLKRFIVSYSPVTSLKKSNEDFSNDESEFRTTKQIHKVYEPKFWIHVKTEKVDQVPVDIDYKVKQENMENENGKAIFITTGKTVCYKHCNGSCINLILTAFICNSIPEKTIHFGKKGNCNICGVSGIFDACETRKYIAFKGNTLFKY